MNSFSIGPPSVPLASLTALAIDSKYCRPTFDSCLQCQASGRSARQADSTAVQIWKPCWYLMPISASAGGFVWLPCRPQTLSRTVWIEWSTGQHHVGSSVVSRFRREKVSGEEDTQRIALGHDEREADQGRVQQISGSRGERKRSPLSAPFCATKDRRWLRLSGMKEGGLMLFLAGELPQMYD